MLLTYGTFEDGFLVSVSVAEDFMAVIISECALLGLKIPINVLLGLWFFLKNGLCANHGLLFNFVFQTFNYLKFCSVFFD